jgi:hypothetical protein
MTDWWDDDLETPRYGRRARRAAAILGCVLVLPVFLAAASDTAGDAALVGSVVMAVLVAAILVIRSVERR